MQIKNIHVAYFSPTGGVRKVARIFLRKAQSQRSQIGVANIFDENITLPESRHSIKFDSQDLVFLFMPVYFGRIPENFHKSLGFDFNGAPVAPIVVFGNRAFDDALRELANLVIKSNGVPIAGAAFVARHSQHELLGASRPNEKDAFEANSFFEKVVDKVRSNELLTCAQIPGLGDTNYKPYGVIVTPPAVVHPERCQICADCAQHCPMQIIDPVSFVVTSPKQCLGCRACTAFCPDGARDYPEPVRSAIASKMQEIYLANKEPKPNKTWI